MPFYIDTIGPESPWKCCTHLIDRELSRITVLDTLAEDGLDYFSGTLVNMKDLNIDHISVIHATLRWEDYPSEECRAGLLDPPSVAPDSSHSNLILPFNRYKLKAEPDI